MNSPPRSCIGRMVARVVSAGMVAAALLPAVAQAQTLYTWNGGSGNWISNPNWSGTSGSSITWNNSAPSPRAFFTAGSGTLTINDNTNVALSTNTGTTGAGMNFMESGTWTLASGSIRGNNWAFGASGSSTIKLTLDNVALLGPVQASLNAYNSSQVEVVLGNLASSTTPLLTAPTGAIKFTVGSDTNLGSIREFRPTQNAGGGLSATGNTPFYSGTVGLAGYTFDSNGYTFSAATLANYSGSGTRMLTITGTGGIAAGTLLASNGVTHTVWTKAGTGFLSVDTLVTSGTQDFIVSAGSMLFNGTSTNLGNVNVASGAILGGTGSLSFAAGKVVTGSAGSIFTADMTAGGLDIAGTLSLAQSGSGVTLRLSGLLPTSGTTTLMSWTTLSTGSFTRITYNDTEVFPDIATPTLGGGMVSYNTVENAIVFIAVPEPAAVCLLAGGAALLGGREIRRRRRRRRGPTDSAGPALAT
jgi:hypothetical protein